MRKEGGAGMQDIVDILKGMPLLKSTIQLYGKPVKVKGYHITTEAAYVVLEDGERLEHTVHKDNLERLKDTETY